jgi:hypothetical protein
MEPGYVAEQRRYLVAGRCTHGECCDREPTHYPGRAVDGEGVVLVAKHRKSTEVVNDTEIGELGRGKGKDAGVVGRK